MKRETENHLYTLERWGSMGYRQGLSRIVDLETLDEECRVPFQQVYHFSLLVFSNFFDSFY